MSHISRNIYRKRGTGGISEAGYLRITKEKRVKFAHVLIAEKALGKPLPSGAEVHHVDENRLNNGPFNLVVCPDHAYHALLHMRTKAFAACGNFAWRKCKQCKQWDATDNLKVYRYGPSAPNEVYYIHAACNAAKVRMQNARKRMLQ